MECNYILEGAGKDTIVFIHGLSDSLEYWIKLSSKLSRNYQILRYDLRGHGKSEFTDFTMDDLADDLHELMLKLDIEKASLIGLSLGGNVALKFALKYPESVENLVIMSSFSEVDDNLRLKFLELENAINIGFEEFFDAIIDYVLPKDILEENYDMLQGYKVLQAQSANLDGIRQGIEIGIDFNVTNNLKDIDVPTLILAGKDDEISSNNLQYILNDNIKDSKLVFFENTKHNLLIGNNISEIEKLIRQLI
ncbi:MAG: alpha/beta hydrolase [Methanobrevibacter sp.]|nr:alpha/beta hydrolase [Methanobrevibacter sp.]